VLWLLLVWPGVADFFKSSRAAVAIGLILFSLAFAQVSSSASSTRSAPRTSVSPAFGNQDCNFSYPYDIEYISNECEATADQYGVSATFVTVKVTIPSGAAGYWALQAFDGGCNLPGGDFYSVTAGVLYQPPLDGSTGQSWFVSTQGSSGTTGESWGNVSVGTYNYPYLYYEGDHTYEEEIAGHYYYPSDLGTSSCYTTAGQEISTVDGLTSAYSSGTVDFYPLEWFNSSGDATQGLTDIYVSNACGHGGYSPPDCMNGKETKSKGNKLEKKN